MLNTDLLLIQYQGKWYRSREAMWNGANGPTAVRFFDVVLLLRNNEWTVIKNRYGDTGTDAPSALMRMQLFTFSKEIEELPEYYIDVEWGQNMIATELKYDKNGNLKLTSTEA